MTKINASKSTAKKIDASLTKTKKKAVKSVSEKAGKTADQIVADLEETRNKIADSVAQLEDYIRPADVVSQSVDKITEFFVDEKGQVKPVRIALAATALLAVIGLFSRKRD
jgi:uncharacterized protein YicC (UPF0701 family)